MEADNTEEAVLIKHELCIEREPLLCSALHANANQEELNIQVQMAQAYMEDSLLHPHEELRVPLLQP